MYLVIADGEQALIIASRSLGQENGPTVRRLVERNHANRNIEGNLGACLKEKELAEYLSQWYKFINSETQIEAETSMAFMQQMFSKHEDSVQKKLKSTFKVYFEEPRMVCKFGLEGVPSKHFLVQLKVKDIRICSRMSTPKNSTITRHQMMFCIKLFSSAKNWHCDFLMITPMESCQRLWSL